MHGLCSNFAKSHDRRFGDVDTLCYRTTSYSETKSPSFVYYPGMRQSVSEADAVIRSLIPVRSFKQTDIHNVVISPPFNVMGSIDAHEYVEYTQIQTTIAIQIQGK